MGANQFGSSTFPFVLGLVNDNNVTRDVAQTFLTDGISLGTVYRNAADRIFFFGAYPGPLGGPTGEIGQEATTNFVYGDVANTFFDGPKSNLAGRDWQVDVQQDIGFTERYRINPFADQMFSAAADPASSRVGRVFAHDATNEFDWNDHDGDVAYEALQRTYLASNTFSWTQTLLDTPEVGDLFDTFLVDAQTLDTAGTDFGGTAAQTFLRQHVTFRVQGAICPEKEYTPFVGESGDSSYPEVSTTPPILGSGVLTLTHPRVTPTLTLTLKNPEFGNSDVITFTKVDRQTRGGDRKFFADSNWGSTQSFELSIENVQSCKVTIDEILEFLNTSLGEEIGLLDWEGRQWKGIIVAPESDVIPRVGGHDVRILFEGELV